ncbi:MAG: Gfo/Idh/MocA family oxidoreductase [Anaerolineaceae bacterium]
MDLLSSLQNPGEIFRKEDLNWGIMSTAHIAEKAVIPAIRLVKNNQVVAVASRDLNRATTFAAKLEIPKAYGSYQELLQDPKVQAVYIPLPNSDHKEWTLRALEAGKHVLVEKSFALNADEAQEMVSSALEHGLVLMENFMYRYNSRISKIIEMVRRGDLGKLKMIQSSFSWNLTNPDDIRLSADLGGGTLLDLGTYCVNFHRQLAGREPVAVSCRTYQGNTTVDLQAVGSLSFGEQLETQFFTSFAAAGQQSTRIVGTEGVLELPRTFNNGGSKTEAFLTKDNVTKRLSFRAENDYKSLLEHFYHVAISRESPRFPLADAVNNMLVLEKLASSAKQGGAWLSL